MGKADRDANGAQRENRDANGAQRENRDANGAQRENRDAAGAHRKNRRQPNGKRLPPVITCRVERPASAAVKEK